MRMLVIAAVLLASWVWEAPASAEQMTLKDLQTECAGQEPDEVSGCTMFILGAFTGLSLGGGSENHGGQWVEKSAGKVFCVPDGLSGPVMRQKTLEMIPADLQRWHEDGKMAAISWVAGVIVKNWPCP